MLSPVTRLTRTIRALILALVLPALLAPSGWSTRLCLCSWSASEATDTCCAAQQATPQSDDESFDSCCAKKRDDASVPVVTTHPGCEQNGCGDCCPVLESGSVELVFASPVNVAVPAAAFSSELSSVDTFEPRAPGRALRACTHSLAPPRASTPLPLRI